MGGLIRIEVSGFGCQVSEAKGQMSEIRGNLILDFGLRILDLRIRSRSSAADYFACVQFLKKLILDPFHPNQ